MNTLERNVIESRNLAFAAFLVNYNTLVTLRETVPELLKGIATTILFGPSLQTATKKAMDKGVNVEKIRERLTVATKAIHPFASRLGKGIIQGFEKQESFITHRKIVDQLTMVLTVSNLDVYFTDTFRNILNEHPELITQFDPPGKVKKNPGRVQQKFHNGEYQGQYDTLEDAILGVYHRQRDDGMNFQNLNDAIAKYGDLGVDLLPKKVPLDRLKNHLATRHLIIHSGGRINLRYIADVGASRDQLGKYIEISQDQADTAISDIFSVVTHMENQIVSKNFLTKNPKVVDIIPIPLKQALLKSFKNPSSHLEE